jgi:EAL domain-containing protein (putative c-di-GMP-specific phosphodiesterase class I)
MTGDRSELLGQDPSSAILSALDEGRVVLALQPVVDAATEKTVSYEGLLRVRGDDGSLVSAADLILEAEMAGCAPLLDEKSLELGLSLLANHPDLKLSLNVSSQTAGDARWMTRFRKAMTDAPDFAHRLTIEITETAMIRDIAVVAGFVDAVRALGCKVAIDDFGAGYTSFRHLKALKVDVLKIDGTFVTDLPDDQQCRVLAKTMIDMAHGLGLETVAEWVGNAEAAAFLRDAGATYLQGYHFGVPAPAEEWALTPKNLGQAGGKL